MPEPDQPGKLKASARVEGTRIMITVGDVDAGALFRADLHELRDKLHAGELSIAEAAAVLDRILAEIDEAQTAIDGEDDDRAGR